MTLSRLNMFWVREKMQVIKYDIGQFDSGRHDE